MGKRLDTKLQAQGAEFLVLGHVLMHGIECYKAYTNFPGYDLIATNPHTGNLRARSTDTTDGRVIEAVVEDPVAVAEPLAVCKVETVRRIGPVPTGGARTS